MRWLLLIATSVAACGDEIADPPSGPGRWETAATVPTPRTEAGVAVAREKMVTVAGFSNVVETYDPVSNSWTRGSDFPGQADHVGAAPLPGGERILVAGWFGAGVGARTETFAYDPEVDSWAPLAPLPEAIGAGVLVLLDQNTIASIGGSSNGGSIASLHLYDVQQDRWRSGPPMPTPRDHLGAAVIDGRLFAIGGRNRSSFTLPVVEIFDVATMSWSRGPDLQVARSGHAVAVAKGKIYVFGGEGAPYPKGTFPEVEALDPNEDTWRFAAPMPTPRHGIQAAVFGDRVHVPMGGDVEGGGTIGVHEVFVAP